MIVISPQATKKQNLRLLNIFVLGICLQGCSKGRIQVTPEVVDFGHIKGGVIVSRYLLISNDTSAPVMKKGTGIFSVVVLDR